MDMQPSTIVEFDVETHTSKQLTIDEFTLSHDLRKIYWVHCNLNDTNFFQAAIKKLHLSDDVIELCRAQEIIPRLIDADEALTLQVQCILSTELNEKHPEVDFGNLIIYLTQRFCFTATNDTLPALLEFVKSYHKATRYAKTPCFILFLLLDNAINDYGKMLYHLEMIADELDLLVLNEDKNIYNEVMNVKHELIKVKRYSIAIREFLLRISSRSIAVISEHCRLSLSNLSSHSHTIVHEIETIREMLNGLLDQIDNALMQRMNRTMQVLTGFAAIFLPLSLITGIYGMNFRWMPELEWKYGYFAALGLILFCGLGLLFVFKKKKMF